MGAHYYRCAPIFALLQKRTQCGEQQAADNQNDCTAKSRRNLGEGHQFHAVSRGKDCHISGTAHVCHTETCGDTGLHRIESDPLANDGRTEERADTGDKAQNEVRQAEALNNRIKAQVAQADADQQRGGQVLHHELEPLVAGHLNILWQEVADLADGHSDNHPCVSVDADTRNKLRPDFSHDETPGEERI